MRKVLVVNDCRLERRVMQDLLCRIGYEVETSDDINSLAVIERYHPDILIANQTMDYIQGTDLIRLVKDKYTDINCYLSSCSPLQSSVMNHDIDGCFQTPISPDELSRLLKEDQYSIQQTMNNVINSSASLSQDRESKEKTAPNENQFSYCPFCGKCLLEHPKTFSFCPFCGGKLP